MPAVSLNRSGAQLRRGAVRPITTAMTGRGSAVGRGRQRLNKRSDAPGPVPLNDTATATRMAAEADAVSVTDMAPLPMCKMGNQLLPTDQSTCMLAIVRSD